MATKSMELFDRGLSWFEFRRGFDFAMQFVIDAPSAESEERAENAQWIPVSERLPEEGVEVLVTCTDGSIRVSTLTDITFWKGIGRGNVLAWMPLPKTYNK